MGRFKDIISSELNLKIRSIGEDRLMENMYDSHLFGGCFVGTVLRFAKEEGIFDAHTCKSFKDWFEQLSKEDCLDDFKTLVTNSRHFMLLSLYLCYHVHLPSVPSPKYFEYGDITISVISSDKVVFQTYMSAAITQSVVLRDLFDCIPTASHDGNEIPLPLFSLVLPNIISFCKKKHKYSTLMERAVKQLKGTVEHLKDTVEAYQAWVHRFVKANKPLLSYLHQAADYLHIPTLLELTSKAMGDMKENTVEDISQCYAGLSIPCMLSPLTMQTCSIISQSHFFS